MYVLGFLADLYRVLKSSASKKTTLNAGQSGSEENLFDMLGILLTDINASALNPIGCCQNATQGPRIGLLQ
jgi:hypothetical protein|tara:strand:+ start:3035 stop:3247 length:213 start_codon:yes stop_codon:yes gene_type:complete